MRTGPPSRRHAAAVLVIVIVAGALATSPPEPEVLAGSPPRNDAVDRFAQATAEGDDVGAPWAWPTGTRVVTRGWEAPTDDYGPGHRGIDVPASLGTTAAAVDDGTVSFAGPVGGRHVVTVDHGDGLVSTLDSVTPTVHAGDVVRQGDGLGTVEVGHCPASSPCLHLGARHDGRYVDPTPYLPAPAWPVLLPESTWDG